MADYSGTTIISPHFPVSSIFTLPNELRWEIFHLLGVEDWKNFRVAAPFFHFLTILLFRHINVRITRSFVGEATRFVSRGIQNISVTTMSVHSNFSRRGECKIVKNGLEVLFQSGILTNLRQLRLFGVSTEIATVLYGFQQLNMPSIRSIVLPDLYDIDQAIYKRISNGLNSLLSAVEDVDIRVFSISDGRFLKWFLGRDNLSNVKTLRLAANKLSPYPRDRSWVLNHLGADGKLSNTLRSLTVDNYVADMSFFDLPLFRSGQLSEIRLYHIHLVPRSWSGLVASSYASESWFRDDWEHVLDKLDKEYRDTGCRIKVRQPRALQWIIRHWDWGGVMDLQSRSPHIEVELE